MSYFFRSILALQLFLGLTSFLQAQPGQLLERVIVANSNDWGAPVSIGWSDTTGQGYQNFGVVMTDAVQSIIASDGLLYVAATDSLVVFDLETLTRLAGVAIPGINQLKLTENKILAGRWFGASSNFLWVLDRYSLNLLKEIPIQEETSALCVHGDSLFVAIPGPYGSPTGKIGLVSLLSDSLIQVIDLDTLGQGIAHLSVFQNQLLAFSSVSYGSSYSLLSKIQFPGLQIVSSYVISAGISWNPFIGQKQDSLFLSFSGGVGAIDLSDPTPEPILLIPGSFATGFRDSLSGKFFLTQTDYFSFGNLVAYEPDGTFISQVATGISPEAICGDYRPFQPDLPPFTLSAIPDFFWGDLNLWQYSIQLDTVFSDPDGDPLLFELINNSNPQSISAQIEGPILTLYRQNEPQGPVHLAIKASANGMSVTDEFSILFDLSYQNPGQDYLFSTISIEGQTGTLSNLPPEKTVIRFFDGLGRKLREQSGQGPVITFDLSGLPPIFFLQSSNPNGKRHVIPIYHNSTK
jgi:hypothetical protein